MYFCGIPSTEGHAEAEKSLSSGEKATLKSQDQDWRRRIKV